MEHVALFLYCIAGNLANEVGFFNLASQAWIIVRSHFLLIWLIRFFAHKIFYGTYVPQFFSGQMAAQYSVRLLA